MNIARTSLILALLAISSHSYAGEEKDEQYQYGKTIHQDHCSKCHGDEVYTREDRFVSTISALGKQVRRCKDNLGITWFDEDTDAVIHFLNKKYYKF